MMTKFNPITAHGYITFRNLKYLTFFKTYANRLKSHNMTYRNIFFSDM